MTGQKYTLKFDESVWDFSFPNRTYKIGYCNDLTVCREYYFIELHLIQAYAAPLQFQQTVGHSNFSVLSSLHILLRWIRRLVLAVAF